MAPSGRKLSCAGMIDWDTSFPVKLEYASSAFDAKQQPPNKTYINLLTKRVSIIQLIATPERFDGKQVFVDGILHHVFEDDTLYLDREMADHLVKTNGIGLVYNQTDLRLIPNKNTDSSEPGAVYR